MTAWVFCLNYRCRPECSSITPSYLLQPLLLSETVHTNSMHAPFGVTKVTRTRDLLTMVHCTNNSSFMGFYKSNTVRWSTAYLKQKIKKPKSEKKDFVDTLKYITLVSVYSERWLVEIYATAIDLTAISRFVLLNYFYWLIITFIWDMFPRFSGWRWKWKNIII